MADTKLLFFSSHISTHNSLHMSYKSTLEFPFSWEIDKNESLCRTGFLKRNFLFPFPSESTKASEFPFFSAFYSSLSLPSRDNHINLLNFKDIISMSATSSPPLYTHLFWEAYNSRTFVEKACVWSGIYFHIVQKDVSLVMNIKKPSGELVYGNEINLLHPPQGCRLSWSIIFGRVGEPDIRQFLPIFFFFNMYGFIFFRRLKSDNMYSFYF